MFLNSFSCDGKRVVGLIKTIGVEAVAWSLSAVEVAVEAFQPSPEQPLVEEVTCRPEQEQQPEADPPRQLELALSAAQQLVVAAAWLAGLLAGFLADLLADLQEAEL
eukprot:TRINITY_DN9674_c0_g1_i1.p2 TRINITY_DN9674_c0_g1~~TRINITY_DN9674_c0_g1_i1.p2  ORF type:complete len:107 (+),score=36.43 TRINITY_DN9674_c0_g1_i1:161-481(+)